LYLGIQAKISIWFLCLPEFSVFKIWPYIQAGEPVLATVFPSAICYLYFKSKAGRTNRMIAHSALAHKLARAACCIMRDNVEFDHWKLFAWQLAGTVKQFRGWQNRQIWLAAFPSGDFRFLYRPCREPSYRVGSKPFDLWVVCYRTRHGTVDFLEWESLFIDKEPFNGGPL